MDKIASEAAFEPQPYPSKSLPDPKHDPIARFASQFVSNMPQGSRMSETSSLKDFELGEAMYTIAERSLENSRPTSAAGSTNSLEFLTSASMMNGTLAQHISHDILAAHDYPGRDVAPRKSILKKGTSVHAGSSVYDAGRSVQAGVTIDDVTVTNHAYVRGTADDVSSVHSMATFTTDKKKVTWDF